MRTKLVFAALLVALVASARIPYASDRVAVYARVDRVVLASTAEMPETIEIWGVFSIARQDDPNEYQPAARGYLFYTLPSNRDAARREWADLKALAGTDQIVSFGSRRDAAVRLRRPNERPTHPDVYSINTGLTKVRGNAEYAPIHALLAFKP